MKTKPTYTELLQERKNQQEQHRVVVTPDMITRKDYKIEDMRQRTIKGSHSNMRYEMNTGTFTAFFSSRHAHMKHPTIHIDDSECLSQLSRVTDPDTHYFNVETDVRFYNLMMEQSFEQRKNIVLLCMRSIQNEKGIYEVHLSRTYVEDCDVVGTPWSLSIKDEVLELYSTEDFHPYRQFYLANEAHPKEITLLESDNCNELTAKELKVLQLAAKKYTILNSAAEMNTDSSTIKSHRKQIMLKLNAPTFPMACMLAKKLKILDKKLKEKDD